MNKFAKKTKQKDRFQQNEKQIYVIKKKKKKKGNPSQTNMERKQNRR